MPLRRILLTLLLLMIAMSIAASLSSRENTTPSTTVTRPAAAAPSTGLARTITGTLPRDRIVRAAVGDRIVLTVEARQLDQVEISDYGLLEAIDPTTPAHFDFIAAQTGRFGVRLLSTGEVLGRIEVVVRPS